MMLNHHLGVFFNHLFQASYVSKSKLIDFEWENNQLRLQTWYVILELYILVTVITILPNVGSIPTSRDEISSLKLTANALKE